MNTLHAIGNWIYYFFGFSGTGPHYGAWSGSLSDVQELEILGIAALAFRHVNCHQARRRRFGHHKTAKGYKLCKRHVALGEDELDLHDMHPDHLPVSS